MNKFIIYLIFISWTLLHIYFLQINSLLKVADSFAYLQMSHYLKNFIIDWFWTGWFGFLYSIPIAIIDFIINNDFLSAKIINIILFFISWILIFKIWKKYLTKKYNFIFLAIFFISSTLIHYNINILSENIYLPIFLMLFLFLDNFIREISVKNNILNTKAGLLYVPVSTFNIIKSSIIIWLLLALLYFTRWEAFIYIWSIFLIFFILYIKKDIYFKSLLVILTTIFFTFSIFISPYIFHLYNITWEIWLTNKWTSNIRQANMRWMEQLDDSWFEKAVWELTEDKKHLIAWFAWWLKYDKPVKWPWIVNYLKDNREEVTNRFINNQKKLYLKTLPKLLIGDSIETYNDPNFLFYNKKPFLFVLLFPIFLLIYWTIKLIFKKNAWKQDSINLIIILWSFYILASLFFTLFFIIDRYFLIFIPILLLIIIYWWQELFSINSKTLSAKKYVSKNLFNASKYIIFSSILMFVFLLWLINYYTYHQFDDDRYELKRDAWIWMKKEICESEDLCDYKIMERFPIVTYYSWTKERWLTPYVDNIDDLLTYALYNEIDFLIVDSMDFEKYRPELIFLLNDWIKHTWLELIKDFKIPWEKVLIYKIIKKEGL